MVADLETKLMSKFIKKSLPIALVLANIAAVVAPVGAQAQQISNAEAFRLAMEAAKAANAATNVQCVKNVFGTGIVATVRWWDPNQVQYIRRDPLGDNPNTPNVDEGSDRIEPIGRAAPAQSKDIAVGQESCFATNKNTQRPHMATVSVYGATVVNEVITIATATAIGVGGSAVCVAATAASTCPVVAGTVAAIANGTLSLAALGVPDAKQIFYAGTPGRLEVAGTAWAPSYEDKEKGITSRAFTARVDFCLTGAADTATSNNIDVEFLGAGDAVISRQTLPGNTSSCGFARDGYLDFTAVTDQAVRAVRVTTDGGDAMLIDEVKVWRGNTLFIWEGRPDGKGWCLSKDANDFRGGWENFAATCSDKIRFADPA